MPHIRIHQDHQDFPQAMPRFIDSVTDSIKDVADKIDHVIDDNKPIIIDIKGITRAGQDCHRSARETSDLCIHTVTKATEMVNFGLEINSTLDSFSGGMDASTFETIKDLIDGDKMRAAICLAGEMDDLALACVDKSVAMIDAMERGVDALPDIVENRIENKMDAAAERGGRDGDPDLPDVEPHVRELTKCVDAIEKVNLFTVMKAGIDAFNGLSAKGTLCRNLFSTIKDFAEDVTEVADAICHFQVTDMMGKVRDLVRDMWRCLRLSSLIKQFAEAVKKLTKFIVHLFRVASKQLSAIWGALAHAKDCLKDCVQHVLASMHLCDEAGERSIKLIKTSGEIRGHLENVASVNRNSLGSIRDLMDGDEIRLAIDLAMNMDDLIVECVKKVVAMIKKVTEGFENLPDVLREGIAENAGKSNDDPEPMDVDADVEELDRCRGAIIDADERGLVRASSDAFSGIERKIGVCRDMITSSRGFADSCNSTIDSFMGVWDLHKAMDHLLEMCRLVKLGELMKHFAEQIMKLVRANIAVLKAALEKIRNFDVVPDVIENKVEDVVGDLKDMAGGVRDSLKKLKLRKK